MKELNQLIKKFNGNPSAFFKAEERIPKNFQKNCTCIFEIPNYSQGRLSVIENQTTHRREYQFLEVSRYYCPICGTEFTYIGQENKN